MSNEVVHRLSDNWHSVLNVDEYSQKPINFLEIGTFYGENVFSVAKSYALHNDSRIYCVDHWEDYSDYPDYKSRESTIYSEFLYNVQTSEDRHKISIHRGYSHSKIHTFQDKFFDIIYIDNSHQPEYVMEDAVLAFRKLKDGGIMIFDDYGWGGPDLTQRGIDAFMSGFHKRITFLENKNSQVFIRKIR